MSRRALGRGRTLICFGAIISAAGLFPSWWTIARTNLAPLTGNGLQGIGLMIFLAAMATLAVLTLPYASRDGDSPLDRPATYVLLGLTAIGAFGFRAYEISSFVGIGLPTTAPGLWITAAGLLITALALADLVTSRSG